jgi:Tfp pilus assembly protein PilO
MTTAIIARVLAEKRAWVVPLAVVFVLNVAGYALVGYPLAIKVRNAQAREQAAQSELAAALQDQQNAQAARTARDRATVALQAFYGGVLPHDLAGARRITYLRLAQLAQTLNLRAQRRSAVPEQPARNSSLGRLKISMTLAGDYEDVRQFIYQLETAPEFVVIEDIALSERAETGSTLALSLELSTYFRADNHGT